MLTITETLRLAFVAACMSIVVFVLWTLAVPT